MSMYKRGCWRHEEFMSASHVSHDMISKKPPTKSPNCSFLLQLLILFRSPKESLPKTLQCIPRVSMHSRLAPTWYRMGHMRAMQFSSYQYPQFMPQSLHQIRMLSTLHVISATKIKLRCMLRSFWRKTRSAPVWPARRNYTSESFQWSMSLTTLPPHTTVSCVTGRVRWIVANKIQEWEDSKVLTWPISRSTLATPFFLCPIWMAPLSYLIHLILPRSW